MHPSEKPLENKNGGKVGRGQGLDGILTSRSRVVVNRKDENLRSISW